MSESIAVSLISAISGIAIAYVVNVMAKKQTKRRVEKKPKDRMEQMFDGYERLIKQKDVEDDRKLKIILALEGELRLARETITHLEKSVITTKHELELSKKENGELKTMLAEMRNEYQREK